LFLPASWCWRWYWFFARRRARHRGFAAQLVVLRIQRLVLAGLGGSNRSGLEAGKRQHLLPGYP
jgi:hypothetical protein